MNILSAMYHSFTYKAPNKTVVTNTICPICKVENNKANHIYCMCSWVEWAANGVEEIQDDYTVDPFISSRMVLIPEENQTEAVRLAREQYLQRRLYAR